MLVYQRVIIPATPSNPSSNPTFSASRFTAPTAAPRRMGPPRKESFGQQLPKGTKWWETPNGTWSWAESIVGITWIQIGMCDLEIDFSSEFGLCHSSTALGWHELKWHDLISVRPGAKSRCPSDRPRPNHSATGHRTGQDVTKVTSGNFTNRSGISWNIHQHKWDAMEYEWKMNGLFMD